MQAEVDSPDIPAVVALAPADVPPRQEDHQEVHPTQNKGSVWLYKVLMKLYNAMYDNQISKYFIFF